jgi:subtilisin-like proprotein convertase family protein
MRLHLTSPIWLTAVTLSGALVLAAALSAAGEVHDDDSHLLVVPDTPPAASALGGSSARVIARYESFTLVEASGDDMLRLVRAGADVRDDMRLVRLRGRRVDPARQRPRLGGRNTGPRAPGLALVQFVGPVKDAWLARVRESGVRVVGYSAQNSYVVHGRAAELERLARLAGRDGALRAAIPLAPEDKLDVGVDTTGLQSVALQTLSGSAGDAARAAVDRLGQRLRPPSAVRSLRTQFVRLDGADIAGLAADPGVVAIEPYVVPELRDERAAQIVAGNLTGTSPSGPGYLSFLAGEGFGSATFDFAVDVTDEGIDKGVLPPPAGSHPDFFESGSASNPTRLAYQNNHTSDSNARDCGGHGTNVASIAAGFNDATGSSGSTAVEDASGFNYGLGIAPRARLGASKIFRCSDGAFDVGGTLTSLTAAAYAAGARVSNNTWGADTAGAYNSDSQEYDSLVRDAQPAVAGNQQIVEVFAAGNAGSAAGTIGAPGTAKNVIAVGASENVRPAGTDGCLVTDSEANSADDIIDFSSRGPTADQRTKPDVIAPGTHVTGASPQVGADYNGTGTCNSQFPSGNTRYSLVSGTSQATPEASGMAALVRDWYRREHGGGSTPPSPAMTKAIMVNTATDVVGGSNGKGGTTANVPNGDQGWGRINLGSALDTTARSFWDQKIVLRETGEELRRTYDVADGSKPIRVTLAWTDPPGPTVGNAFVNDLNLAVEAGGSTYKGNVLSGGQSVAGGSADPRNNVENVYLPAGTSGPVDVRVVAANLAADGVPGAGDETDQDFALVVSNGSEQPAPLLVHETASIADPAGDGDSVVEPGEPFSLQETLRNSGTAAATSVSGALSAITPGVTVTDNAAAFPNISAGATGVNSDALAASVGGAVPCGTDLRMTLDVTTAQGAFVVPIRVPTGAASSPASLNSGDVPKSIASNHATTVTSTLSVPAPGLIKDLDVRIGSLLHTWVGDLRISLIGPDATTVVLTDRPGGLDNSGDNLVNTVFDDEASASINSGSPPYSGSFRLNADQLSRFDGKQQQGTWTLQVEDLFGPADGGSLQSWGTDTRTAQCSTSGDTNPPNVTLANPVNGSATSDTTPALSGGAGSASGDSTTVTVKIWSGTVASGTPLQTLTTTRSGGSWSTTAPALAQGTYTVRAEQSDDASNTGLSSANTFRVDTSAPAVTVTTPADGSYTNDTTPSLAGGAGSSLGDSGTVTVKIWSGAGNTSGAPLHTLTPTRSGGSWSETAPTLAAGAYTVVAEQADDAGNNGTSAARSFTVDTTAPVVTLTSPADGALTTDSTPVLSGAAGTAAGDSNDVTVRVWAGTGTSGSPVRTLTFARSGGSWSAEVTPGLGDGTYTARAEQSDSSQTGMSDAHVFTVDTSPPETTITAGPSGTVLTRDAAFEFASSEPDGAGFECRVDGASFSGCSSGQSYSGLADGPHQFEVRALDRAGNPDGSPAARAWTVSPFTPLAPSAPLEPFTPFVPLTGARPLVTPLEEALAGALRGGVVAQFACRGPCRAAGTLTLSSRAARRLGLAGPAGSVVVGRASRRLSEAGAGVLTVKLTRRARRALARVSRASLVLRLTLAEQSGERNAYRRRVLLRRLDMVGQLRRGMRLSLACSELCRARARLRRRGVTIARGSLSLPSAGAGRLTVTFTREARRRLRSASLVRARLTIVVSGAREDTRLARTLYLRG